jgi:hypothetical protein
MLLGRFSSLISGASRLDSPSELQEYCGRSFCACFRFDSTVVPLLIVTADRQLVFAIPHLMCCGIATVEPDVGPRRISG